MKTTVYELQDGTETTVYWDDLKFQHLESIDHSQVYECQGYDDNNQLYTGTATFTCGELDGIEDVEMFSEQE